MEGDETPAAHGRAVSDWDTADATPVRAGLGGGETPGRTPGGRAGGETPGRSRWDQTPSRDPQVGVVDTFHATLVKTLQLPSNCAC